MKKFRLFVRVSKLRSGEILLGFKKAFWIEIEAKDLGTAVTIARIKTCFTYCAKGKKVSVYYPLQEII